MFVRPNEAKGRAAFGASRLSIGLDRILPTHDAIEYGRSNEFM